MSLIIDQLIQQGVTDFFFAPGSRSTPLALSAASHPKANIYSHFDERGLGFYALGCAQAKQHPACIIVTSGTAVGNLFPAVMEAHHASVPLIFLTADRPAELQASSANQTTDQSKLFGSFVRFYLQIDSTSPKKAICSQITQAVAQSQFPHPGPVHLNCPFREPLYPIVQEEGKKILFEAASTQSLSLQQLPEKTVVLVGRLPRKEDLIPILHTAREFGWPLFADLLSSVRSFYPVEQIKHFDWFFDQNLPRSEAILHFGERLTSKRVMQWLEKEPPAEYWHVSPYSHWIDPSHLITHRIAAQIPAFCRSINARKFPGWLEEWQELDKKAEEKIQEAFAAKAPLTESLAMHIASQYGKQFVFLGNSMPIREADWFLFPQKTNAFFSNRGLSGIDGNLATAAGLSIGLKEPLLAIVGDLTALHDLNSLALIRKSKYPITLVISNNHGGGIFSHLPVAKDPRFEQVFGYEHTFGFEQAAKMFSLPYHQVKEAKEWERALQKEESCVIELITCRKTNKQFHEKLRTLCSRSSMAF